jgi:hypothetical protein
MALLALLPILVRFGAWRFSLRLLLGRSRVLAHIRAS